MTSSRPHGHLAAVPSPADDAGAVTERNASVPPDPDLAPTSWRPPWEIVETFPSTDVELVAEWEARVAAADDDGARVRALVGRALTHYWATHEGVTTMSPDECAWRRRTDTLDALRLARASGSTDAVATALLGVLAATWGPEQLGERGARLTELESLRQHLDDEELRLRIIEWRVLDHLDRGERDAVDALIDEFARESARTELVLFRRREILWRGCLAMLDGRIDEALAMNQAAISATADTAGSPFSFQNVAITVAIERYLRCGLADVVETIRSIRASSHRVGANWDTGLAFALSQIGEFDEAAALFRRLGAQRFQAIPRDLNWLVTMYLNGLIALALDDDEHGRILLEELRPFAAFDATHGSGYASYGPVGRVVASLAARWGDAGEAESWFRRVLTTRAPGPWTSLTLLDRATAREHTDPHGAMTDAATAATELGAFGMDAWADRARALWERLRLAGHGGPIAVLADHRWTLRHRSGRAVIDAGVGATHLARLLSRPGEPIDVAELDPTDASIVDVAGVRSTLDGAARLAYRRRADALAASQALSVDERDELEFLRRELAGARHRTSSSAELERARVRVTKAIRRVIDDIADQSPDLAHHIRASIETGRTCIYDPPIVDVDDRAWFVVRHGATA